MKDAFVFEKRNFIILGVSMLLIVLGFVMMAGGGSEDPNVFNPEIFNFRRITLAPMVILLGFILGIVSIMLKPKSDGLDD